jgi:hypothetical protein
VSAPLEVKCSKKALCNHSDNIQVRSEIVCRDRVTNAADSHLDGRCLSMTPHWRSVRVDMAMVPSTGVMIMRRRAIFICIWSAGTGSY